jgi:hypothetical protein
MRVGGIMIKTKKEICKIIENLIKEMDYPTKKELWKALPTNISFNELSKIVDNLEES